MEVYQPWVLDEGAEQKQPGLMRLPLIWMGLVYLSERAVWAPLMSSDGDGGSPIGAAELRVDQLALQRMGCMVMAGWRRRAVW
jgi:hypothetical protein